jgi:transcriptional regulator with XRE-family HTH domain
MLDISASLKEMRAEKGQSLQEVADAIGASKAHVWEIENGRSRNPSINLLQRLADHFGISVSTLIGEDSPSVDDEALAFYRSVRSLSESDREVLKAVIDGMKSRKAAG